ncbi:MAG TPA: UbiA family prenyltransferase [Desulfopila sp.]|nr:UbiA family prenyltransferase [Desulfopila sp.]
MKHPLLALVARLRLSVEIAKVPLCLLVGISALFGNIFAAGKVEAGAYYTFASVFMLACGGASLNSWQERFDDSLMVRTRKRPLVLGSVSTAHGLLQSALLVTAGLAGLLMLANSPAFWAGLIGITSYNVIYTRLKAFSLWAILPGAFCGAIPPCIGWLAADGKVFSSGLSLLMALLFFWQIPHFLLIILRYQHDYASGIAPNLLNRLSERRLQRIFLPWITALALTMITFTVLLTETGVALRSCMVVNAALLVAVFGQQLLLKPHPDYNILFHLMNISLLLFMIGVAAGRLWAGA